MNSAVLSKPQGAESPLASGATASLDRPASLDTTEKLGKVCRDFEAVFLQKIIGQTRAPRFKTKEGSGVGTTSIYQDLMNQPLAGNIGRTGAFGLAKSRETQLSRQLGFQPHPRAVLARTPPATTPLND